MSKKIDRNQETRRYTAHEMMNETTRVIMERMA